MNSNFVDIYGAPLQVGDRLAVPFPGPTASSPAIRIGTVLAFGNRKGSTRHNYQTGLTEDVPGDPTMELEWEKKPSHYGPEKSKMTDRSTKRYLKL